MASNVHMASEASNAHINWCEAHLGLIDSSLHSGICDIYGKPPIKSIYYLQHGQMNEWRWFVIFLVESAKELQLKEQR